MKETLCSEILFEKQAFVLSWERKPLRFSAHQCLYSFLLKGVVSDPGWVWSVLEGVHLTFQSDDCGAVEVQQGGQGTAVCVVLQQILHQGERGSAPLLSVLFPIASLKPWQRQRYRLYVSSGWIHAVWVSQRLLNAHASVCSLSPRITLNKQVLIKTSEWDSGSR